MKALLLVIFAVFAAVYIAGMGFFRLPQSEQQTGSTDVLEALDAIGEKLLLPGPLKVIRKTSSSRLTQMGVLSETNRYRAEAGLAPLSGNTLLDTAAKRKADDMFAFQYFAHESPSGQSAADLARDAGYAFIMVGENLAQGNFTDDKDLVQAWMDSPGHRANLLHVKFSELGIAVVQGLFEGKRTWIAVQEFGMPTSACPEPDAALRARIAQNESALAQLRVQLDAERVLVEGGGFADQKDARGATQEYNRLAEAYNSLIAETKSLVNRYNVTVRATNACALE